MSAVNVAYGWTMPTPTLQHTRKVQQKSRSKMRSLDAKATATVESLFSSTSATLLEETETTVTLSKESSLLNGTTMVVYDSSVDDNMSLMGAKSTTSTNQKQTTPSSSSSPVQTVNMDLASIKTKMDATETEMAAKSSPRASSSSSMLPPSIARASQLLKITWNEFLLPVGQAIRNAATDTTSSSSSSSSWSVFSLTSDEFWQLPIMVKAEPSSPTTTTTTTTVAQQFTRLLEILGVTYVKFGQALSARPDIVPRPLAVALTKLQDQMDISQELQTRALVQRILEKEWESTTSHNNVVVLDKNEILDTLSERPEAAASIGVVYSAYYQGQKVCVKIQRPNIAQMVQQDAQLLRTAAKLLESIPPLPGSSNNNNKRFIQTDLSGAVEEFMSRIVEELDYRNEAANIELFGSLYSHRRPTLEKTTDIQVVVPKVYREMCTEKVVVMEWIDGVKLVDLQRQRQRQRQQSGDMGDDDTTRDLIQQGIDCTLSQLLDTGILHADPHGGNLLKVIDSEGDDVSNGRPAYRLGYVDFGLLSTVPLTVQDGLICAVAQLIFAKNVEAVANLFGELQLLPAHVLENSLERQALSAELDAALSQVLVYDHGNANAATASTSTIPSLRFDKLLDVLARLVPRFQFQLPPYFLNNARALSTLEGMAREIDPSFNVLQSLYPYTLQRLLCNPSGSAVVDATLKSLVECPTTGRLQISKLRQLVRDASWYSGYSQQKIVRDVLETKGGRVLLRRLAQEQSMDAAGRVLRRSKRLRTMTNYLRL